MKSFQLRAAMPALVIAIGLLIGGPFGVQPAAAQPGADGVFHLCS